MRHVHTYDGYLVTFFFTDMNSNLCMYGWHTSFKYFVNKFKIYTGMKVGKFGEFLKNPKYTKSDFHCIKGC